MEINKIHNVDFLELAENLPAKCANLIIADPPYYKVKGDFDFIWPTFDAYLQDVEKWARACKYLLADNGSLYWWGHAKKIAYSQVILDNYFSLLNNAVWWKYDAQTNKNHVDDLRSFAPVTERCLVYEQSNEHGLPRTGLQEIYSNADCFSTIKSYLRAERDKVMRDMGMNTISIFNDWINNVTGTKSVASRHYFADSQWCLPTEELYKKMQSTGYWQRPYFTGQSNEGLRNEYEELRNEYEELRRPFNPKDSEKTDLWKFSQEANITGQEDHDTQKPPKLIKAIIETSSRPGDLVIVPFSGSGTEAAMAIKLGRNFYASEIDKKHCDAGNLRVSKAKAGILPRSQEELKATGAQPSLFDLS